MADSVSKRVFPFDPGVSKNIPLIRIIVIKRNYNKYFKLSPFGFPAHISWLLTAKPSEFKSEVEEVLNKYYSYLENQKSSLVSQKSSSENPVDFEVWVLDQKLHSITDEDALYWFHFRDLSETFKKLKDKVKIKYCPLYSIDYSLGDTSRTNSTLSASLVDRYGTLFELVDSNVKLTLSKDGDLDKEVYDKIFGGDDKLSHSIYQDYFDFYKEANMLTNFDVSSSSDVSVKMGYYKFPPLSPIFVDVYSVSEERWIRVFSGLITRQKYNIEFKNRITYDIEAKSFADILTGHVQIVDSLFGNMLMSSIYSSKKNMKEIPPHIGAISIALSVVKYVLPLDDIVDLMKGVDFRGLNFSQNASLGQFIDYVLRVANVFLGTKTLDLDDLAISFLLNFRSSIFELPNNAFSQDKKEESKKEEYEKALDLLKDLGDYVKESYSSRFPLYSKIYDTFSNANSTYFDFIRVLMGAIAVYNYLVVSYSPLAFFDFVSGLFKEAEKPSSWYSGLKVPGKEPSHPYYKVISSFISKDSKAGSKPIYSSKGSEGNESKSSGNEKEERPDYFSGLFKSPYSVSNEFIEPKELYTKSISDESTSDESIFIPSDVNKWILNYFVKKPRIIFDSISLRLFKVVAERNRVEGKKSESNSGNTTSSVAPSILDQNFSVENFVKYLKSKGVEEIFRYVYRGSLSEGSISIFSDSTVKVSNIVHDIEEQLGFVPITTNYGDIFFTVPKMFSTADQPVTISATSTQEQIPAEDKSEKAKALSITNFYKNVNYIVNKSGERNSYLVFERLPSELYNKSSLFKPSASGDSYQANYPVFVLHPISGIKSIYLTSEYDKQISSANISLNWDFIDMPNGIGDILFSMPLVDPALYFQSKGDSVKNFTFNYIVTLQRLFSILSSIRNLEKFTEFLKSAESQYTFSAESNTARIDITITTDDISKRALEFLVYSLRPIDKSGIGENFSSTNVDLSALVSVFPYFFMHWRLLLDNIKGNRAYFSVYKADPVNLSLLGNLVYIPFSNWVGFVDGVKFSLSIGSSPLVDYSVSLLVPVPLLKLFPPISYVEFLMLTSVIRLNYDRKVTPLVLEKSGYSAISKFLPTVEDGILSSLAIQLFKSFSAGLYYFYSAYGYEERSSLTSPEKISVKESKSIHVSLIGLREFSGECSKVESPVPPVETKESVSYTVGYSSSQEPSSVYESRDKELDLKSIEEGMFISHSALEVSIYDKNVKEGRKAYLFIKANPGYARVCENLGKTDKCCAEYYDNLSYTYKDTHLGGFIVLSVIKYTGVEKVQGMRNTMPFSQEANSQSLPISICIDYLLVNNVQVDTYLVIPKKSVTVEVAIPDRIGSVEPKGLNDYIELNENGACVERKIKDILDSRLSRNIPNSSGADYIYYVYGDYKDLKNKVEVSKRLPFSPDCFYFIKISSFSFENSGITDNSGSDKLYVLKAKTQFEESRLKFVIDKFVEFSNLFVRSPNSIVYSKDGLKKEYIGSMFMNSLVNFSESNSFFVDVLPQDSAKLSSDIGLRIKSLISIYPSSTKGEPFVYGSEFSTDFVNTLLLSFLSDNGNYGTFSELFLGDKFGYFYDDRWTRLTKPNKIDFFDVDDTRNFYEGLVTKLSSINIKGKDGENKYPWRDTTKYYEVIDFLKDNKDLETFSEGVYNILVPVKVGNSTVRYAIPSDVIFSDEKSPFLRFYINIPSGVNEKISKTSKK
jgi:hypothetical protein